MRRLGRCNFAFPVSVQLAPREDRMAVKASKGVGDILLTSETVSSVFVLSVDDVSGYAVALGFDERQVVSSRTAPRPKHRSYVKRSVIA